MQMSLLVVTSNVLNTGLSKKRQTLWQIPVSWWSQRHSWSGWNIAGRWPGLWVSWPAVWQPPTSYRRHLSGTCRQTWLAPGPDGPGRERDTWHCGMLTIGIIMSWYSTNSWQNTFNNHIWLNKIWYFSRIIINNSKIYKKKFPQKKYWLVHTLIQTTHFQLI